MTRMKYRLLTLLACLLTTFSALAQDKAPVRYAKEYAKADSLINSSLPKSARKIVEGIYQQATGSNQPQEAMKAQIYLMRIGTGDDEDASVENITTAEQEARKAGFPYSNMWHSIAAELYWNYYQSNRYQILERTKVAADTATDITTWDATHFFNVISAHYRQSLEGKDRLGKVSLTEYEPLVIRGENTATLRPMLYDLLAFRAVGYYENDEKEVTQPAYQFTVSDARLFEPASQFVKETFSTKDTASLQYKAILLYQDILTNILIDTNPDRLIDADLHRLTFVYEHSTMGNKKELYRKALQAIADMNYAGDGVAQVYYLLSNLAYEEDNVDNARPYYRNRQPAAPQKHTRNLPQVRQQLETIVSKWGTKTEGGVNAQNLLNQILSQDLSLQCEQVVLPNEASKVLVSYRNVGTAYFRVIKLSATDWHDMGRNGELRTKLVTTTAPIAQWQSNLPGTANLEAHSTEIKVDGQQPGIYAVIISSKSDFDTANNQLSYAIFQSSSLAMVMQEQNGDSKKVWLLNRKTGEPLPGANITLTRENWNDKKKAYETVNYATAVAGATGMANLPTSKSYDNYNGTILKWKDETLYQNDYLSLYSYNTPPDVATQHTYLFTDRAIYRPGQTIYFKGILVESSNHGRKAVVVPNRTDSVTFYDVNSQKIKTLPVTTNEYGSFTGTFTAPERGLTGEMRIQDDKNNSQVSFSIEEYKRPKFNISFDTLSEAYRLNQSVTVKGKANAFAGNAIDGATVKYRVVRNARWPYWWAFQKWGSPTSGEQQLAEGTTQTGADGSFTVTFTTTPDNSVPEESLPLFTYTITADVTDINGETHSGSQSLTAGYRSIDLTIDAPEKARAEDMDSIYIHTANLNGNFVAAKVTYSIAPLQAPGYVPRTRRWAMPDEFAMDSLTYRQNFPQDEYRNESDYHNWPEGVTAFTKSVTTTKAGTVSIPANTFTRSGWYVITATTEDAGGKKVEEKKYVQVWSKSSNTLAATTLAVFTGKTTLQPGETATATILSGYSNAHLIQAEEYTDSSNVKQVTYDGQPLTWAHKVTEADRGGMAIQWLMLKENRVYYTAATTFNIPWSNKDLDLTWQTHRDKLEPGAKDSWTITIRGDKKEKIAAEMMAGMYDASLDEVRPHSWYLGNLFANLDSKISFTANAGFGIINGNEIVSANAADNVTYSKEYDELLSPIEEYNVLSTRMLRRGNGDAMGAAGGLNDKAVTESAPVALGDTASLYKFPGKKKNVEPLYWLNPKEYADSELSSPRHMMLPEPILSDADGDGIADQYDRCPGTPAGTKVDGAGCPIITIRKNLSETAFFIPQLHTDEAGNIRFSFTMPEALTEWKFMALAHTKDMSTGTLTGRIRTQKDLMVTPGLPRFFRQGDDITVTTKISNLSDAAQSGTATLELLDATTNKPLNTAFRLTNAATNFTAAKGGSTSVSWAIHIPESLYQPVIVRIAAQAGNFTDGEENTLPVLSNRMLITETLPLWMNGNGTKTFTFDKLLHSDTSKTLSNLGLTVEYTANPAWYAVQALPYLMEYPYECAEQTFNRYYANALAAHILDKAPKVKAIFDQWQNEDTAALQSNLNKNEELKTALLEETPWVLDAQDETAQKHRIALLFESHKLSRSLDAAVSKLNDMLLPEGAFPWFKGMGADRYITQYITTGIGRLKALGVTNGKADALAAKTIPYLDRQVREEYESLLKIKGVQMDAQHIGNEEIQYLYMRSFFTQKMDAGMQKAYTYYKGQAAKYWSQFNPYIKGMTALALNRSGDVTTPQTVLQSLRETAIRKDEMGTYWMQPGYWWYETPIEAQSLIIECFAEVGKDTVMVNDAKRWLLKQKQTQNWESTKATADACYALLKTGSDWLTTRNTPTIQLGTKTISSNNQKAEAGTGYFKTKIQGKDVMANMGTITVSNNAQQSSTANNVQPSWGAVYWQYFEDMDKITPAATLLSLTKKLFLNKPSDNGSQLTEITDGNALHVGDKVTVRIILRADRDMEYVHLKDNRAACFEPGNGLSGYQWQQGLGYYQSTKDASTNFFIGRLNKGTYVFEYPLTVTSKGSFSNGVSTIQCMYAPEFTQP